MRLSQTMTLSIWGASCTGKSTAGRLLAEQQGLALRCCGDVVRTRAKALSISVLELPDGIHTEIDAETRQWVRDTQPCVVEGRFLDVVLASLPNVISVRLVATEEVRANRASMRSSSFQRDDLRRADQEDDIFRQRMYGCRSTVIVPDEIDTSAISINELVERLKWIVTRGPSQHT